MVVLRLEHKDSGVSVCHSEIVLVNFVGKLTKGFQFLVGEGGSAV
jgi:hypothetical protein